MRGVLLHKTEKKKTTPVLDDQVRPKKRVILESNTCQHFCQMICKFQVSARFFFHQKLQLTKFPLQLTKFPFYGRPPMQLVWKLRDHLVVDDLGK